MTRRRSSRPGLRLDDFYKDGEYPTLPLITGVGDSELATSLEVAAADSLKRVRRTPEAGVDRPAERLIGTKTVWPLIGI